MRPPGEDAWSRLTSSCRPKWEKPLTSLAASADIKGVTLAEDVTGPYDVIVRAEAGNVDDLGKLVVAQIQCVSGITRTLTCPIVHI